MLSDYSNNVHLPSVLKLFHFIWIWVYFHHKAVASQISATTNASYLSPGDSVALTCVLSGNNANTQQLQWMYQPSITCAYCTGGIYNGTYGNCNTNPANVTSEVCTAVDTTLTSVILIRSVSADAITTWTCQVAQSTTTVNLYTLVPPGPPTISNYPLGSTATVTAGDPITFTCTANGGTPAPRLTWYLQTPEGISTQQTQGNTTALAWKYTPVKQNNGYEVFCQADQPGTSGQSVNSNSVSLNVQYSPGQATAVKSDVSCLLYGSVTLACKPNSPYPGNPAPTFTWTRNGGGSWTVTGNDGSINVNVGNMCNNQYTCTPHNIIGDGMGAIITINISARANVTVSPSPKVTVLNTASSLPYQCIVTGRPAPNVVVSGNPVPSIIACSTVQADSGNCGLIETTASLQWATSDVNARKTANGQTLLCKPTDGFATVISPLASTLDVQYAAGAPSNLLLTPPDYTYAGNDVNMTCKLTTEGNPETLSLGWYVNYTSTVVVTSVTTRIVAIQQVDQQGYYSCSAVNYPQSGQLESPQSPGSLLVVRVAPSFTAPTSVTTLYIIYNPINTNISCTLTAKPDLESSQVVWQKNGKNISGVSGYAVSWQGPTTGSFPYGMTYGWTSTLRMENTGRKVTCDNVADYDGPYTCYATDGTRDNTSMATTLQTLYPALWSGNPEMVYSSEVGNSTKLTCSVCQNPPGTFKWMFNGNSLPANANQTSNYITLTNVTVDNFGNYTCTASNVIQGTTFASSFVLALVPVGPPDPPTGLVVVGDTSVSITLQWICGSDNGVPGMTFAIYVKLASQPDNDYIQLNQTVSGADCPTGTAVPPYTVGNLVDNTDYNFRVKAYNQYGSRGGAQEYVYTQGKTSVPPNVTIETLQLTDSHVNLTWAYLQGEAYVLRLYYQTQGSRRRRSSSCEEGWDYLPPAINGTDAMDRVVYRNHTFDLSEDNIFILFAYEDETLSNSCESTGGCSCSNGIITPPMTGGNIGAIVGGIFGFLLIALLVVGGFLFWTRYRRNPKQDHSELQRNTSFVDPSAHPVGQPVLYAEVRKHKSDHPPGAVGTTQDGYDNVGAFPMTPPKTGISGLRKGQSKYPEEVIYAELEWPPPKKGEETRIHRKEPPTIYATIDFSQKADPLPEEPVEDDDIWGTVPEDLLPPDED